MILETKRLILRKPEATDVEDYLKFCNSEFVLRYNAMVPQSREDVLRSLSKEQDGSTLFIQREEDGTVIGEICIHEDSLRYGMASKELSYFLGEDYSRQGYMKEALGAVVDYLFREESLECVAARCFAPNEASRALLHSLGFHQDGYIPRCVKGYGNQIFDDTLYSLLRTEWDSRNSCVEETL